MEQIELSENSDLLRYRMAYVTMGIYATAETLLLPFLPLLANLCW